MDFEVTVPDLTRLVNAGEDCGEARKEWRMRAASIVGDSKAIAAQNDIDGGKYRDTSGGGGIQMPGGATTSAPTTTTAGGGGIQMPGGGGGIQMPGGGGGIQMPR